MEQSKNPTSVVGIEKVELINEDPLFKVSDLTLRLDNGGFSHLLKTQLDYNSAVNVTLPTFRPESPLDLSEGAIVVGPVAYKTGKYHRTSFAPRKLDLMYPARTTKGLVTDLAKS